MPKSQVVCKLHLDTLGSTFICNTIQPWPYPCLEVDTSNISFVTWNMSSFCFAMFCEGQAKKMDVVSSFENIKNALEHIPWWNKHRIKTIFLFTSVFFQYEIDNIHWFCSLMIHWIFVTDLHINGLVQKRHNSSASAMELCVSCTNPSIYQFVNMTWFLQCK